MTSATPPNSAASSPAAVSSLPDDAPAMTKAKTPISPGRITVLGLVLAVAFGVLGLIGVRDALISANAMHGTSWIESTIHFFNGLKPQWWTVPVGVVMALAGLWILSVALLPRPRTAVSLHSQTGVFMRPRDVKKLAARAADDVDGVVSTQVSATRRAARLSVVVTGDDGRISQDVQDAVAERLAALDPPPRLKIKAKPGVAP